MKILLIISALTLPTSVICLPQEEVVVIKKEVKQSLILAVIPELEFQEDLINIEEDSVSTFVHGTAVVKVHDRGVEERNKGQPN